MILKALLTVKWNRHLALVALLTLGALQSAVAHAATKPQALEASVTVEPGGTELSCENTDDNIQDVIEQMADLGYGVVTGEFKMWLPDDEDRNGIEDKYFVENFDIPFAERNSGFMVTLYDADDEGAGEFTGGINSPQDILVMRLCTPIPEGAKTRITWNSFLLARETGTNELGEPTYTRSLRASLTDPLRLEDLAVVSNDNSLFPAPYDRKTNIAFSPDQASLDELAEAFTNAGLGEGLNLQGLPTHLFDFGPAPEGYPLTNSLRVVMKWERLEDFHPDAYPMPRTDSLSRIYTLQSFPFYRFYRDETEAREPIAEQRLDPEPDANKPAPSKPYRKPFNQLVDEVIAHYEGQYGYALVSDVAFSTAGASVDGQDVFNAEHGAYCIENTVDCQFDSSADAYWWDQQSHLLGDNDVYVIVGVDHAKLGMAEDSHLGIYNSTPDPANGDVLAEVASWTATDLAFNTVNQALVLAKPNLEEVAKLSFIAQLARPQNCVYLDNIARCPDMDTILPDDPVILRGRSSYNPATGTRPSDSQLIPWRLLHFKTAGDQGGIL